MNCSTPGLPVHHQLLESTQTHVHWVGDAIQPSCPLLSVSPPALNLSQHQGLCKWVSSSHQVAKVLEFQLQHQSFQWNTQDWSPLGWTGWIPLQSKGLSIQMAKNSLMRSCSRLLLISKMHIKTTRFHYISIWMAEIKKTDGTKWWGEIAATKTLINCEDKWKSHSHWNTDSFL